MCVHMSVSHCTLKTAHIPDFKPPLNIRGQLTEKVRKSTGLRRMGFD